MQCASFASFSPLASDRWTHRSPRETMGAAYSMYTQTFPPAPKWGLNDIPDLSGRVAVVTGGYAGIGAETAKVR
jgi:hypothetical protein